MGLGSFTHHGTLARRCLALLERWIVSLCFLLQVINAFTADFALFQQQSLNLTNCTELLFPPPQQQPPLQQPKQPLMAAAATGRGFRPFDDDGTFTGPLHCYSVMLSHDVCKQPPELRYQRLRTRTLPLCDVISPSHLFPTVQGDGGGGGCVLNGSKADCEECFRDMIAQDALQQVQQQHQQFVQILHHYNCEGLFSTKWTCNDCKEAYKNWLCSVFMPVHRLGYPVPPCGAYCARVMTTCPYFLPVHESQYAGEPQFLCAATNDEDTCHLPCSHQSSARGLCFRQLQKQDTSAQAQSGCATARGLARRPAAVLVIVLLIFW